MRRCGLLVMLLCVAACGPMGASDVDSLLWGQPRVVAIAPAEGAIVAPDAAVAMTFSQPIEPSTLTKATLAIVKLEGEVLQLEGVAADVVGGDRAGIDGLYEWQRESCTLIFHPELPWEAGARYAVIATSGIQSEASLPLNQRPGRSPAPFMSSFSVAGGAAGATDANAGGAEGSTGSGDAGGGGAGGTAPPPLVRPETLLINEVLYDAAGVDTNGDVFIELLGDAGAEIGGYKVILVSGDDGVITATIELPPGAKIGDDGIYLIADAVTGAEGTSHVAGADFIKNFDPQNGPDGVQMVDDAGRLLDALGYGTPIIPRAANGLPCSEGTPAAKAGSGQSLGRTAGADTDNNAADFRAQALPTPGVP